MNRSREILGHITKAAENFRHRRDAEVTGIEALCRDMYRNSLKLLSQPVFDNQRELPEAVLAVAEGWFISAVDSYSVIPHPENGSQIAIASLYSLPDPVFDRLRLFGKKLIGPENVRRIAVMEAGESELMILHSDEDEGGLLGSQGVLVEMFRMPPRQLRDVETHLVGLQTAQRYRQLVHDLFVAHAPASVEP